VARPGCRRWRTRTGSGASGSGTDRSAPDLAPRASARRALGALGAQLWSCSATRGGLVFVAASMAVGLSNFVFYVVLSRLLGPSNCWVLRATGRSALY